MSRLRAWLVVALVAISCCESAVASFSGSQLNNRGSAAAKADDDSARQRARVNSAANQAVAQLFLSAGWRHETGNGAKQDDKLSSLWYREAAIRGNATAQFNLGLMYLSGRGVEQDDTQAAYW